eukprot:SAG22_NODE_30_length_28348_cov_12.488584_20_plen_221_part_00
MTTDAQTGKVTQVEAINDVSSMFLYKGIYHIFHQCCQNHWDHVVSKCAYGGGGGPCDAPATPPPPSPAAALSRSTPCAIIHSSPPRRCMRRDLVHWTRLPPPIVPNLNPTSVPDPTKAWYDAHGSWDGSLSIPRDESSFPGGNGIDEPVVLMTAVPGKAPPNTPPSQLGHITMAIVRASDKSDPFLLNWTKDDRNPIKYSNGTKGTLSTPFDTPGQIWKK